MSTSSRCHARFNRPRLPRNDICKPLQLNRAHTYRLFIFLKSFAAEQREVRILRILERPSIPFSKKVEILFINHPRCALDWHFSIQKPSLDQLTRLRVLPNDDPAIFSLSHLNNDVCAARKQKTTIGNLLAIDADTALIDHPQSL